MLNNTATYCWQHTRGVQHNIVESCFHQPGTTCSFLRVYRLYYLYNNCAYPTPMQLSLWRKPECPEKTRDSLQSVDILCTWGNRGVLIENRTHDSEVKGAGANHCATEALPPPAKDIKLTPILVQLYHYFIYWYILHVHVYKSYFVLCSGNLQERTVFGVSVLLRDV